MRNCSAISWLEQSTFWCDDVRFELDNTLGWIFIVNSDTLSWFPANKSLLLFLNAACLAEKQKIAIFSSPDPKGHVSYCHHLASVVVVRRKLFQKSSLLKVLDQWKPNLVWIITRVSSFKIVSGDAVHQPTWPLLLKIEHMVKLQVFGNNSKTVDNIKNLTWGKNDQHIKIYLPCNFEVNLITHLGVIALFSSNL